MTTFIFEYLMRLQINVNMNDFQSVLYKQFLFKNNVIFVQVQDPGPIFPLT